MVEKRFATRNIEGEIEMCLGLKDCNNNKVYENDILEVIVSHQFIENLYKYEQNNHKDKYHYLVNKKIFIKVGFEYLGKPTIFIEPFCELSDHYDVSDLTTLIYRGLDFKNNKSMKDVKIIGRFCKNSTNK